MDPVSTHPPLHNTGYILTRYFNFIYDDESFYDDYTYVDLAGFLFDEVELVLTYEAYLLGVF